MFVSETIDNIVSWNNIEYNGSAKYEIYVDGKLYRYDPESGLIGNEKTAYITGKEKELFDRIMDRHSPSADRSPKTTITSLVSAENQ
jgi:hypothetical protein